ncbi:hypothetical protein [Brachybacterium sp. J153]|uniref:hypothetical protein n=1 Tax=Brachybacterium sp. J153 TaxID=3116488 RepID=UPI002E77E048|nr:hypothetical protein [Brachybacterium sp. J153]MEE1617722.1 hypothetical protein [Brachybacterium sp. J153]
MTSQNLSTRPSSAPPRRSWPGLPWLAVVGLALLAVPRVVLHDLDLIHEGTFVNLLFVVVPPLVWILVVLLARVPRPFLTVLTIGAVHGVLLALTHQLLWGAAFPGGSPRLGGNLAGLDPLLQEVLVRAAAVMSSLVTGLVVGVVVGLVAALLARVAGSARAVSAR